MAGTFELFKDKAGKFRFRLKASNGQVIATGEAYETKASAAKGIESVRKNAIGAVRRRPDLTGAARGPSRSFAVPRGQRTARDSSRSVETQRRDTAGANQTVGVPAPLNLWRCHQGRSPRHDVGEQRLQVTRAEAVHGLAGAVGQRGPHARARAISGRGAGHAGTLVTPAFSAGVTRSMRSSRPRHRMMDRAMPVVSRMAGTRPQRKALT